MHLYASLTFLSRFRKKLTSSLKIFSLIVKARSLLKERPKDKIDSLQSEGMKQKKINYNISNGGNLIFQKRRNNHKIQMPKPQTNRKIFRLVVKRIVKYLKIQHSHLYLQNNYSIRMPVYFWQFLTPILDSIKKAN